MYALRRFVAIALVTAWLPAAAMAEAPGKRAPAKAPRQKAYASFWVGSHSVNQGELLVTIYVAPVEIPYKRGQTFLFTPTEQRTRIEQGVNTFLASLGTTNGLYVNELTEDAKVCSEDEAMSTTRRNFEAFAAGLEASEHNERRAYLLDGRTLEILEQKVVARMPSPPRRSGSSAAY